MIACHACQATELLPRGTTATFPGPEAAPDPDVAVTAETDHEKDSKAGKFTSVTVNIKWERGEGRAAYVCNKQRASQPP